MSIAIQNMSIVIQNMSIAIQNMSIAIQNTVVFESEAYNKSEVVSYKQSMHKYLTTHY
jgi:hypothetical protein